MKTKTYRRAVSYIAERNPMNDYKLEYRIPSMGVAFDSLDAARRYFAKSGFELIREKATRKNRLYC